jgi:hypothetical protein
MIVSLSQMTSFAKPEGVQCVGVTKEHSLLDGPASGPDGMDRKYYVEKMTHKPRPSRSRKTEEGRARQPACLLLHSLRCTVVDGSKTRQDSPQAYGSL